MKIKKPQEILPAKTAAVESMDFVVDMAVEFWRLQKRAGKIANLNNSEGKAFFDQMERLINVFEKFQIEIHDPKDEIYKDGRSLKAIYIEEVHDLPPGECRVIETVKPSVICKGVQIFQGEVIVGQGKSKKPNKVGS